MKISFDLDETLICSSKVVPKETASMPILGLFYREEIRHGTKTLFIKLRDLGYQIGIYTTSERPVDYIKGLFKKYGIKLDFVINGIIHNKQVQGNYNDVLPSKLPSKYRIDLHIDDDVSVYKNGIQHGFSVLLLKPEDNDWVNKVIKESERIKIIENRSHGT